MTVAVQLDDKYTKQSGRVLLNGTQALVRLPLMQRARDAAAGLNTAGFISGYRGSPLGGYDQQLTQERARLAAAGIRFEPGVNEDLAATAIWGSQQVGLLPGARVDGVFAIWYGKGPGVDRAGDPIKHGNRMGSSRHGGVLLAFGDDHAGKSSTIAHQSELAVAANGLPVLYPATVQEYLQLGLHGFALSRFSGTWVGFKCVNETVESTATVDLDGWPEISLPEAQLPEGGVHARHAFDPLGDDSRLHNHKLPLVQRYVRHNRLDGIVHAGGAGGLGIVAAGKSYLDVEEALHLLELDEARLARIGIGVYKPALIWPLEPEGLTEFARERRELLFVEEKAPFMEQQAARILYGLPDGSRPRLSGKRGADGSPLLPVDVPLEPLAVAQAIGARLEALELADETLRATLRRLRAILQRATQAPRAPVTRTPYFCSGCPHNTSTRVPEGSLAMAGIGCHTLALFMNRHTLPPTQMGGEGANWCGMAPFSDVEHVFQNLGDGTYFHSGSLAIRAAVTSGVNITYKILLNDAVAMTGGQPVEGGLSAAQISWQLRAERVQRIAVVSDDIGKYRRRETFAPGVTFHPRAGLDVLQRELRAHKGVSALIYEQTCAAEKRRRRKRGTLENPSRRVFINAQVCEGCGDCSVQSNCVSVLPLATEFGRKRRIDQSACNKDFSCLSGFCPSFVTVEGAQLRRPAPAQLGPELFADLPEPPPLKATSCSVLITGIGGTGVVTIGALLAMAAHLESQQVSVYDMTGLAQKGGAVFSHVKLRRAAAGVESMRMGTGGADVVLGCDLVVTASAEALRCMAPGRTSVVLNEHLVPTGRFQLDPDEAFQSAILRRNIDEHVGAARVAGLDANTVALRLLGDAVATNMLLLGVALQKGLLPVSPGALREAIRLNGAAVEFNLRALELGRVWAAAPRRLQALLQPADANADQEWSLDLDALVETRARHLADYQHAALAQRYRDVVARASEAECRVEPCSTALAEAVARGYHKLLAYKDEYEVARLHTSPAFEQALRETFAPGGRLKFHLAPPILARRDPLTGMPRKRAFGAWILPPLRLLARLRRLRGTRWDVFGYGAERRLERQLIRDYEHRLEVMFAELTPARLPVAIQLARLPERIRGFGPIKARALASAREQEARLLADWERA
ncbi:MAG: indolepyruvate ferredoxin oxidoreductase family protein [Proteobacteria bacterium]|nr:indolepyruvate ferredoxin oxidoreductase family protein [Pseudomonadota bacterium]